MLLYTSNEFNTTRTTVCVFAEYDESCLHTHTQCTAQTTTASAVPYQQ